MTNLLTSYKNFTMASYIWHSKLSENSNILSPKEKELANILIEAGQGHLFQDWDPIGVNDEQKHEFFQQIQQLNSSYIGGLSNYIERAKVLLAKSKSGDNPFDGWKPEVHSDNHFY